MKRLNLYQSKAIPIIISSLLALGSMGHSADAQVLSGREIIAISDQQQKAKDQQVEFTAKLISKNSKERTRQVVWMSKTDSEDNLKSLIRILSPKDVRGTGLLTIENAGREDDQWLYPPQLRKTRQISASEQSDSFLMSDFTFEDIRAEEMGNYDYTLIKTEVLSGIDCYVIEAVPNNEKERKQSGYSKRELWIRMDNFVLAFARFYDKKGELCKQYKASDIRFIDGAYIWRAHRMEMEDIKTEHKTVLLFNNFVINSGIQDAIFTKRYLER